VPLTIAFAHYGPPEVLKPYSIDEPQAGEGEVRVRVRTAGVAPFDCRLRRGEFSQAIRPGFPHRLGNEFAGVVDQVGPGVTSAGPGTGVIGFTVAAAYAEVITVPVSQTVGKPAEIPWAVAGALPVAGQGAYSVVEQLGVHAGDVFLVHAAAGGLGTFAVQLGVLAGATVIGTASEANHDYLRSLGAIPVTYGDGLLKRIREVAPGGIDVALDAIGGDAVRVSLEAGAAPHRVGTLINQDQAVAEHGIQALAGKRSAEVLGAVAGLVARGDLCLPVTTFGLLDAAAAHRRVESGHGRGKTVLVVNEADLPA
jgi:enoyl reductase